MEWFHEECRRKKMIRKVSSDTLVLLFVNLQPSNPTSVNTCLCFADEECRKRQQRCIMTFVQPPFITDTDIISQAYDTDELSRVIVLTYYEKTVNLVIFFFQKQKY
ncbi:hypothetical protein AVEN_19682-1 [Araneus ventricosus]|uniref:Uncharacterized protein n=1 Tax=Araneus ventricosus TaxID=182803 RepID=A0A4Y2C2J1_ARAVE|nr:hypothetical protein AVEN_19682-1 [Araneus ventricosus]